MYKEIDVVMLPTNEKAMIHLAESKMLITSVTPTNASELYKSKPLHLYFLADDEIKDGDWFYDFVYGVKQYKSNLNIIPASYSKKIIVTTDTSLGLPQPFEPFIFIKYYVDEYNKGNIITKVEVEYADYLDERNGFVKKPNVLSNNTVNVRPIKEKFYTQEEVIELFHKYKAHHEGEGSYYKDVLDRWLKENL